MQTSYPNLVDLLDQETGKDLDKLVAQDPNAAHNLALLDRDIIAFNRVKGFSTRCKRAFKQSMSQESFEVIADFRAEMEVGRLFLEAGLLERFEAPLAVPMSSGEKPPDSDLLVTVNGERIWVEVKRIRRTRTEVTFQKRIEEIAERIRTIPSSFFVGLSLDSSRLQPPAVDRIVEEIAKTLAAMETEKSHVEEQLIWLNDNGKETRLGTFSVSPKRKYSPDEATAFSCLSQPVPYSEGGSERKKFWDDLTVKGKKLQKLPDNEAGFIFFWVDSGTHEEIDLLGLLEGRLYGLGDSLQEWSRWQIDEFFQEYQKVTGVIMRAEHEIASVSSSGTVSYGPRDQKRFKIHWNPYAVNKLSEDTATMLAKLLG